jgi:hypothetical protein
MFNLARATRLRALVVVCSVVVAIAGCAGSADTPLTIEKLNDVKLRDVGDLYRIHQITNKKPPKSLKDFMALGNATPTAFEAIRSGEIIVRYGATLPDTEEEPKTTGATEVLAYQKEVPTQGGPVLMLDRSIRKMTAEEFKAAKLAGTDK